MADEGQIIVLSKKARELFSTIQEELDQREEDLKDGLSFLDLKNDTLLSYMIDVCNIMLHKVRGATIEGIESVERCVEYRVILEKIKSIDQKLAYQLNKLITMPDDAVEEGHRIDVNNLDIDLDAEAENEDQSDEGDEYREAVRYTDDDDEDDDDDEEEEEEEEDDNHDDDVESLNDERSNKRSAPGVYKPPKLRSVAYTEENEYKRGAKGRRKNYDEFYQDVDQGDIVEETRLKVDEDRVRFEEDNYTRLSDKKSKKPKRDKKNQRSKKKFRRK